MSRNSVLKHLECIRTPRILYLLFHPYLLELSMIHLPSISYVPTFAGLLKGQGLDLWIAELSPSQCHHNRKHRSGDRHLQVSITRSDKS